jgi:hypothetical protein
MSIAESRGVPMQQIKHIVGCTGDAHCDAGKYYEGVGMCPCQCHELNRPVPTINPEAAAMSDVTHRLIEYVRNPNSAPSFGTTNGRRWIGVYKSDIMPLLLGDAAMGMTLNPNERMDIPLKPPPTSL